MNWETYIAYGDSITIGARSYLGYPEVTGSILSDTLNKTWNVVNHAISGFKTIDLARYITSNYTNLKEFEASISTLLIGTNDVKENTSTKDFKIALDLVLTKVKLLTVNHNVVTLSIPLFPKGIMYPYKVSMNEKVIEFNEIIVQLSEKHGVRHTSLNLNQKHFYDGVHLNETGIYESANQVSSYILNDKGIYE
jgi:lysophospholipase L1-like esterase